MRQARYAVLCAAAVFFLIGGPAESRLMAGEIASQPRPATPSPFPNGSDPFAEVLETAPIEVVKAGSSCQIIKIPLPPGVEPEEIAGVGAP